ncbi:alpha/beta fold hydrolase [Cellulomonas fimi]|uniref:alpha/beta fold hydrolase n=1 Tax=Cellulomonas fimi TaxID=1708 RepID=UPI00234CD757|nr:alpha/beta fold hydrolase [Cellulomonas fimi]MDC7120206.1 alpha/beta fold hydrolase [Cellulomonas fimi]
MSHGPRATPEQSSPVSRPAAGGGPASTTSAETAALGGGAPSSALPRGHHPSRSAAPDVEGVATRGDVRIAWAVYGDHHDASVPTVVLVPTWSIVPSRFWKLQVGYLARHFRVVTFDGRGSGASSRPVGAAAYTDAEYAADLLAVLDATSTSAPVLVTLSCGAAWAVHHAARHPSRVSGIVAIAPSCGLDVATPGRDEVPWDRPLDTTHGWAKYNKHYWLGGGYDDFVDFFFRRMFPEPHSTKQIEDCVGWAHEITPQVLADTTAGRLGCDGAVCESIVPLTQAVTCPVLVVHGSDDRIRPLAFGERLAELTRGSLVVLDGAGHGPPARDPVKTNHLIRSFVERVAGPSGAPRVEGPEVVADASLSASSGVTARRTWTRARNRPRRVLYLSSPIGLGHAQRDVAIAAALRERRPDLQIDWLAQHPVTRVLAQHGERVHPASAWLRNESGHVEHEAGEHDLHAFQAIRRMDEILVSNFMVFSDVVESGAYDLVVGDEAWDVDYFLHENPELKRFAFAWMTDFVGWLPMPDGGAHEAALTADYNADMIEQRARFARVRDRSVFVGSLDDVVDQPFGPDLPSIRSWTADNFSFAGYVTGFDPAAAAAEAPAVRASLGVAPDERLCVVTVGGSGVGGPMLQRVLDAVPAARSLAPDLRFVVVAGPRIDPASLPAPDGATVLGYVPDLYRLSAACDVAVVQGGLTTCMELTALRKPFVYVPLRHHFEQTFHVRARLDRYEAGRHLPYEEAVDPDGLAEAIAKEAGREVTYRPVETDGAARAADLLADLV